ncbi:unnamed protein product [Echinostoma caproni]|uniref:DUF4767 domain-containing protein n=1 Tax=Echinostoma caproni TaxID=27848 RepID=A0A183APX2_9TREM|nr:unnamed protein product [Echinostoma caproni]
MSSESYVVLPARKIFRDYLIKNEKQINSHHSCEAIAFDISSTPGYTPYVSAIPVNEFNAVQNNLVEQNVPQTPNVMEDKENAKLPEKNDTDLKIQADNTQKSNLTQDAVANQSSPDNIRHEGNLLNNLSQKDVLADKPVQQNPGNSQQAQEKVFPSLSVPNMNDTDETSNKNSANSSAKPDPNQRNDTNNQMPDRNLAKPEESQKPVIESPVNPNIQPDPNQRNDTNNQVAAPKPVEAQKQTIESPVKEHPDDDKKLPADADSKEPDPRNQSEREESEEESKSVSNDTNLDSKGVSQNEKENAKVRDNLVANKEENEEESDSFIPNSNNDKKQVSVYEPKDIQSYWNSVKDRFHKSPTGKQTLKFHSHEVNKCPKVTLKVAWLSCTPTDYNPGDYQE